MTRSHSSSSASSACPTAGFCSTRSGIFFIGSSPRSGQPLRRNQVSQVILVIARARKEHRAFSLRSWNAKPCHIVSLDFPPKKSRAPLRPLTMTPKIAPTLWLLLVAALLSACGGGGSDVGNGGGNPSGTAPTAGNPPPDSPPASPPPVVQPPPSSIPE